MVSAKRFYMFFGRVWRPWKALGGVMEASGSCLGRLGQALGRLNCVLDATWGRLGEFGRRLEANLRRLGGFRKPLKIAKDRPRSRFKSVQGCFWSVF